MPPAVKPIYPAPLALDAADLAFGAVTGAEPTPFPVDTDTADTNDILRLIKEAAELASGKVVIGEKYMTVTAAPSVVETAGDRELQLQISGSVDVNPEVAFTAELRITRSQYLAFVNLARAVFRP